MAIYRLEFTDEGEPLFIEESNGTANQGETLRPPENMGRSPEHPNAPEPPRPAT